MVHSNNTSPPQPPTFTTECYHVFRHQDITGEHHKPLIIILIIIFIFIVTSNILLIFGVRKTSKNGYSSTNKMFLYLSVIDLSTGLFIIPNQIAMIILGQNASCFQVGLQAFLNALTPLMAMNTIFTMSILRYLSIEKPMRKVSGHTQLLIFGLQFLLSLALTIFYVISSQTVQLSIFLGIFMLIVTLMCLGLSVSNGALNGVLYMKMKRRFETNTVNRMADSTDKLTRRHIINQKKAIGTLLLISTALVVCYMPNGILFGVISFQIFTNDSDTKSDLYSKYSPWGHVPMLLNAGLDSFIYIIRKRSIFRYYKIRLLNLWYGLLLKSNENQDRSTMDMWRRKHTLKTDTMVLSPGLSVRHQVKNNLV